MNKVNEKIQLKSSIDKKQFNHFHRLLGLKNT